MDERNGKKEHEVCVGPPRDPHSPFIYCLLFYSRGRKSVTHHKMIE